MRRRLRLSPGTVEKGELSISVDSCRGIVDNCRGSVELDSLTALLRLSRLSKVLQRSVVSKAVESCRAVELSSCRGCVKGVEG